jgi:hypothetical protein
MSEENVELVKEFTRLFEKGDRDKWCEVLPALTIRISRC